MKQKTTLLHTKTRLPVVVIFLAAMMSSCGMEDSYHTSNTNPASIYVNLVTENASRDLYKLTISVPNITGTVKACTNTTAESCISDTKETIELKQVQGNSTSMSFAQTATSLNLASINNLVIIRDNNTELSRNIKFIRNSLLNGAYTWKVMLIAGDNSINAFDNARLKLKDMLVSRGVATSNIEELSVKYTSGDIKRTSASNAKQALTELNIGSSNNDACFVHMTSHGNTTGFYISSGGYIKPQDLSSMLDSTCGNAPTVVMVSACHSGVFIENGNMKKSNRIILTAAASNRTSFGCGAGNVYTFWDECLINNFTGNLNPKDLYNKTTACVQRKEGNMGQSHSLPQAFFGKDVENIVLP